MKLKLMKSEIPRPDDFTWEYEWRNVYYLHTTHINKEAFELDIYKGPVNAENPRADENHQDGTPYLRIFGLDRLDTDGNPQPDGLVDHRQIDFVSGHLVFPQRCPFCPCPNTSYTGDPADTLKEGVRSIYSSSNIADRREDSNYYIYVEMTCW
jgi:cell surface protein SprA